MLIWRISILVFSGQPHGYAAGHSSFLGLTQLCGDPHPPLDFPSSSGQLSRLGTLLEPHSMGALLSADVVFSGHYLVDGRKGLPLTILCRSHSVRPRLEHCQF